MSIEDLVKHYNIRKVDITYDENMYTYCIDLVYKAEPLGGDTPVYFSSYSLDEAAADAVSFLKEETWKEN